MLEDLWDALRMLADSGSGLLDIVRLTILVSGSAVFLAALIGVPAGTLIGLQKPKKVRWIIPVVYTLMGLPPVVGGLVVYLLIRRQGVLGPLGLLYSPAAMIIAQVLLATPIVTGLTAVAVRGKGREALETLRSLGADRGLILWTIIREARYGILGALIAGFGRVVAEVGAVMIVGGNIKGHTRVMTTAIVMETRGGRIGFALALAIILLLMSLLINAGLYRIQAGGPDE
jgi:tungstate transport system permease protein